MLWSREPWPRFQNTYDTRGEQNQGIQLTLHLRIWIFGLAASGSRVPIASKQPVQHPKANKTKSQTDHLTPKNDCTDSLTWPSFEGSPHCPIESVRAKALLMVSVGCFKFTKLVIY